MERPRASGRVENRISLFARLLCDSKDLSQSSRIISDSGIGRQWRAHIGELICLFGDGP